MAGGSGSVGIDREFEAGRPRASRRALLGAAVAGAAALTRPAGLVAQWGPRRSTSAGPDVFPAHDTWTASPETEISFRGIAPEGLGAVRVVGTMTGGHTGIMAPHADGNGASYLPDASFAPGEVVTVSADIALSSAVDGPLTFGVVRPLDPVRTPPDQ